MHLKSNETEVVLAERRAKARERRDADRYASVPRSPRTMPVDDAEDRGVPVDDPDDDDDDPTTRGPRTAAERAPEATGRGRVVPTTQRPVGQSPASGRQQPTRQPKSKRGKK